MLIIILTFASVALIHTQNSCTPIFMSPGYNQSMVRAASIILVRKGDSNFATQKVKVFRSPNISYDVVGGVTYIQTFYDPKKLEYFLNFTKLVEQFHINFFTSDTANWTRVFVTYIYTRRTDLTVETAQISNLTKELSKAQEKVITYKHTFKTKRTSSSISDDKIQSFIFLQGISSSNRFIQVSISKATIFQQFISFNISLQNLLGDDITFMQIGIFLYVKKDKGGGVIIDQISDKNLLQNFYQNMTQLTQQQLIFFGVTRISAKQLTNFSGESNGKRRLLTRIIQTKRAAKFLKNFQVRGFKIRQMNDGVLLWSRDDGQNLSTNSNNTCATVLDCLQNGGMIALFRGQKSCIKCRPNAFYDQQSSMCKCKPNYVKLSDNNCSRKQDQLTSIEDLVACRDKIASALYCNAKLCKQGQQYNFQNQTCQCKKTYIRTATKQGFICAQPCPFNTEFDLETQKCVCPNSNFDNNGECQRCPTYNTWDSVKNECVCAEKTQKFGDDDKCRPCPNGSTYDYEKRTCDCDPGRIRSGNRCKVISKNLLSQPLNSTIDD